MKDSDHGELKVIGHIPDELSEVNYRLMIQ